MNTQLLEHDHLIRDFARNLDEKQVARLLKCRGTQGMAWATGDNEASATAQEAEGEILNDVLLAFSGEMLKQAKATKRQDFIDACAWGMDVIENGFGSSQERELFIEAITEK